jgi:hypothetical protein
VSELSPAVEQQLADMTEDEYTALTARVRPPTEPLDPKARAAAALRRELGVERRGKATKESAAEALRRFATGR